MFDPLHFLVFFGAALALAIAPGPGMLYVAARSISGGRAEGLASSFGTALGGFVHVIGGAIGVTAILMASAEIFTALKLVGAVYLVWLGIRTWRQAGFDLSNIEVKPAGCRRAFVEGIFVEMFNPKTAAFFLAFVTQFVDPARGNVALQFVILGAISVTLNTTPDIIIAFFAGTIRRRLLSRPQWMKRTQRGSGALLCGLGLALAFARRPA
ncbi:LysE family translocator [Dongia sp.]|jgi:threonine/homoserine/homoserine lactone efflux protein|uniref:LysE family translocator n=1 Tax=Dongia sp. TaxID=1977262 RepID=UPI0035ADA50E